MYQEASKKWEETIYKSTQSVVNIYIDGVLLNPKFLLDFKFGQDGLLEDNLELGSVPSQYIEMQIHKNAGITNPKTIKIEYGILINNALTVAEVNQMLVKDLNKLQVKSLAKYDNSFEMIPIGIYNVDDYDAEDDNVINIKALDNIIKLDKDDGYYDASELINRKGYATLGEIAQDICDKKGLELETSSFLNSDEKVSVYDNQLKARQYMSYIAEKAGGIGIANRTGKIEFRKLGQDTMKVPLKLFKKHKFGEEYKVSKVAYEDGIRSFKYGDETRNTLWIRQDNLFVPDENGIKKIYDNINGLTINSFEGTVIIDPRIDIGDILLIGEKPVIYQGEMTLNKRFIANIKSKISIKQKQETTVKKEKQIVINRRVQSEINQIDGKITQLIEENTETSKKLAEHEQTIDGFKDIVKDVEEKAIKNVDVQYALSNSETTAPTTGWSTTAPAWQDGKYMWQKTVTTFADDTVKESQPTCISGAKGQKGDKGEQGLQGLQGEQGLQGIPGTNGMDGKDGESGKTTYFHIKYSSVANPATSSQMTETPNTYIGTYVDFTETDSTDPSKYTWSQFKGSQGEKGEKGIPGTNGTNGKTSYLHIAYATNSTGTTGFSVSDSTDKTYIGQYTDFTEKDSADPTKYSWSLIKGDKGDTGLQGPKGADGKQLFTWLKYADTPTSGMSDNPSGKNYIGLAYNKDTAIESTNYSDYTWSLIKGEKGDTGVAGPKGADGQQFYTWIKYADSPTTGMSDSPNNKNYIGLAYNKTTSAESSNYADYTWSLIKGDRGLGIKKLVEQYYLSTSNTTQTGGSWKTSQDKWTTGHYVWTRTKITWDDDTVTYTDPVLSNNLDEAFSQIEQNKTAIAQKVAKNDFGTLVEQNAEHVKIAWNKISEYLQMEVINGNVSLAIRNEVKKLLMALDKLGQHFYNGNYSMDIGAFDCYFPSYGQTYKSLMFALNEKSTNNFMAWGYKGTTESGEVVYTPVVFLGGQSDSDYGFHVNSDLFMGFNAIRFTNSKIFDNNDSLMFEVGEDIFIGDTRDGTEILSIYNNNGGTKTVDFHSCSLKADNLPTFDSSINHVTGSANHRIGLIFKDGSSVYIYADSSDKNLKKNIRNAKNNALKKILKINHKQFDWKSNNEHQEIGYIAQEMQKIDKTFVHYAEFETPDGEKKEDWQINTLSVLATATKAIQEQQEEIEKNNKTIQDLLARVESLEKGANK